LWIHIPFFQDLFFYYTYYLGSVLVGRFADPSWNDLIAEAGALVLEMGQ
jgi:hypothetical protein